MKKNQKKENKFGSRVKEIRLVLDMKQQDFANQLGIGIAAHSEIERDKNHPFCKRWRRISGGNVGARRTRSNRSKSNRQNHDTFGEKNSIFVFQGCFLEILFLKILIFKAFSDIIQMKQTKQKEKELIAMKRSGFFLIRHELDTIKIKKIRRIYEKIDDCRNERCEQR